MVGLDERVGGVDELVDEGCGGGVQGGGLGGLVGLRGGPDCGRGGGGLGAG